MKTQYKWTLALLFVFSTLVSGVQANTGYGDSPAFVLDTRVPEPVEAFGISDSFALDTRQVEEWEGFGISSSFVLDTRVAQKSTLEGYVSAQSRTGQPMGALSGATVQLSGGSSTTTDGQGKYRFSSLDPGSYTVSVSKSGFLSVSRSISLSAGQTKSESFTLQQEQARDPQAYNASSQRGQHLIEGMPGSLTFETTVSWNGSPGTVRFRIAGTWRTATISDLGGGRALASVTVSAPGSISNTSEWAIEVTNGEGGTTTTRPGVYFYPMPQRLKDWYQGTPSWSVSGERLRASRSMNQTLWDLDAGVVSTRAGYNMSSGLNYDPRAGAFRCSSDISGGFGLAVDLDDVQAVGEGRIQGEGSVEYGLRGFNNPSVEGTVSVNVDGKGGFNGPAIHVISVAFPKAAPVVAWVSKFPVIKDARLHLYLIGGLGVSGRWTSTEGNCWLGASSYDVSGTFGIEGIASWVSRGGNVSFSASAFGTGTPRVQVCPEWKFQDMTLRGGWEASLWVYMWLLPDINLKFSDTWEWVLQGQGSTRGLLFHNLEDDIESEWQPIGDLPLKWGDMNRLASKKAVRRFAMNSLQGSDGATEQTILENVTRLASPSVLAGTEGVQILFALHDPEKPWYGATDIGQVVNNGGDNWSLSRVTDDENAEFGPRVVVAAGDETRIAAWVRIDGDVSGMEEPDEIPPYLELVAARQEPASGGWSAPEQLTDNEVTDRDPQPVVFGENEGILWVQNEGDHFIGGATQGDRLLFVPWTVDGWGETVTLWSEKKGLLDYSFAADADGEGHLVFSVDEDGDLDTINDQELYYLSTENGIWQAARQLTTDEREDAQPTLVAPEGAPLCVWREGDQLLYSRLEDWNPRAVYGDSHNVATHAPSLAGVGLPGGAAIAYTRQGAEGADIVAAFYDASLDQWSQPRQITNDEHAETGLTLANDGNELLIAYLKTEIERTDIEVEFEDGMHLVENAPQTGRTDLCVLRHELGYDLAIQADSMQILPANSGPGEEAFVYIVTENRGDLPVESFDIVLYDGDPLQGGALIGSVGIAGPLLAGATQEMVFYWRIPPETYSRRLYAFIDPDLQFEDRNRWNNRATVWVVLPNLAIETCWSDPISESEVALTARIINDGVIPAGAFDVVWRLGSPQGQEIGRKRVEGISVGGSLDITFDWELDEETFDSDFVQVFVVADPFNFIIEPEVRDNESSQSVRIYKSEEMQLHWQLH
jgi:hypothetical protein